MVPNEIMDRYNVLLLLLLLLCCRRCRCHQGGRRLSRGPRELRHHLPDVRKVHLDAAPEVGLDQVGVRHTAQHEVLEEAGYGARLQAAGCNERECMSRMARAHNARKREQGSGEQEREPC